MKSRQSSKLNQKAPVCPPLRKVQFAKLSFSDKGLTEIQALSTPAMAPMKEIEHSSFPAELRDVAAAARKEAESPERWMCVVVRREVMRRAVGRIVHVQQVRYFALWIDCDP